jgi:hypothetical protein
VLKKEGAAGLLKRYGGSLYKALKAIYPEYAWNVSYAKKVPQGYWNSDQNIREYMDLIGSKLSILLRD